ncbi:MAG: hypothetical protein HC869_03370 [Rhodospirillales bacterium]|nr:hypothetical protein [Rhodospirillales bacterium]
MESATRYADYMDMPKLKVELLFNRGQVALERGDTKAAGKCATKALAAASYHGMKLRKISAVELLGEIILVSARRLFVTVQKLAETIGYQLKGDTAHEMLLRKGLQR